MFGCFLNVTQKKTTLVSSPEFPGVFFGEAEAGALSLSSSLGLKADGDGDETGDGEGGSRCFRRGGGYLSRW